MVWLSRHNAVRGKLCPELSPKTSSSLSSVFCRGNGKKNIVSGCKYVPFRRRYLALPLFGSTLLSE